MSKYSGADRFRVFIGEAPSQPVPPVGMRRGSYNKKSEAQALQHADRYVTSYNGSFQRPHTAQGGGYQRAQSLKVDSKLGQSASQAKAMVRAPQKFDPADKVTITEKQPNRKFGSYDPVNSAGAPKKQESNFFGHEYTHFKGIPTGYTGGRDFRCSDRFVRYPYPSKMFSVYAQHNYNKLAQTVVKNHKQAFNMEKETKIINPHKMELATTTKSVHNGAFGERAQPRVKEELKEDAPMNKASHYATNFPSWKNGKHDIFHEKHPQYPYYQVQHRGISQQQREHTGNKIDDLKNQIARVTKDQGKLQIVSYEPKSFGFETTNNINYPEYKFVTAERTSKIVPQVKTVQTRAPGGHFDSHNKHELRQHKGFKQAKVDFIPYP